MRDVQPHTNEHAGSVFRAVMSSRFTYAINWYTVSPALYLITVYYHAPVYLEGFIASFFFLAVGLFQLPAGVFSSRFGSKETSIGGLLLLSVCSIATPFAPSFVILLLLRFMAGIGAAFFFAPAIGLLSSFFRKEERTQVIGIYNASFQLGAGTAVLIWPYLISRTDWQTGVILGGLLSLITCAYSYFGIDMRKASENSQRSVSLKEVREVILNRKVWMIALGFVGIWGVYSAATQFMVIYSKNYLEAGSVTAGILSSLILFVGIPGGYISGPLSRLLPDGRKILLGVVILFSLSLLLFTLKSMIAAIAGSLLLGMLFTAGVTVTYALPAQMKEISFKNIPLAVSLVNSVQVLGGFWVPALYGYVAVTAGYAAAWLSMLPVALLFIPFYLALKI